ncbi:MAG: ATP-binding cassette domain-containing protein [Prevotella sp.]
MQKIISIRQGVPKMEAWQMAQPVDFELNAGEHIAIIGPNGGGKSMLVHIITGSHPVKAPLPEYDFSPSNRTMVSENIKYIAFRDTYGGENDRTYFLQQRWNHAEISDDTPMVEEELEEAYRMAGNDSPERQALKKNICTLFGLDQLNGKMVISLSSGELRKFKLACSLFSMPRVLIIDNPFIGLDAETRLQFQELLGTIAGECSMQIILVMSKAEELPAFITHVVEVSNMTVGAKQEKGTYVRKHRTRTASLLDKDLKERMAQLPCQHTEAGEMVNLRQVEIRYADRVILQKMDWTVRKGEHWALMGKNGSGKSTLLSLVCADNPQGYACDISLFGRKRGSGESIWEIKKGIGYVSPEMHRAYHRDLAIEKIVASGLNDSMGLYIKPNEEQIRQCDFWMQVFGISHLSGKSFLKISSGEQRLVLLARAFVKNPQLIILDEPMHGLDTANTQKVREIIDTFCRQPDKTLIMVTHYLEELPSCIDHYKTLEKIQ